MTKKICRTAEKRNFGKTIVAFFPALRIGRLRRMRRTVSDRQGLAGAIRRSQSKRTCITGPTVATARSAGPRPPVLAYQRSSSYLDTREVQA